MRAKKPIEEFIATLKKTNRDWSYFTSYEGVIKNFELFEDLLLELGTVNEQEFRNIMTNFLPRNPEYTKCIPLFTGIRNNLISVIDNNEEKDFDAKSMNANDCLEFLEKVGFFKLFEKMGQINLPSYFMGIEVGMDTNGRKNRGGKLMEKYVREKLEQSNLGLACQIKFSKLSEWFNIQISKVSSKDKQFDFAFIKDGILYLVETNFFNSNGSKINETLRSYISLNNEVNNEYTSSLPVEFVLITDGLQITSDKNGLEDAYRQIKNIYNIDDLENGLFEN